MTPNEMDKKVSRAINEAWKKDDEKISIDHAWRIMSDYREFIERESAAEIAALKAEVARLREACNKATEIERLALSIERGEEWTGGEPTLGTCKILGKIKAIGITCEAALAASPVEAEPERGPEVVMYSESDIWDAFEAGYMQGHNDTVESCVRDSKEAAMDYFAELQRRIEAER